MLSAVRALALSSLLLLSPVVTAVAQESEVQDSPCHHLLFPCGITNKASHQVCSIIDQVMVYAPGSRMISDPGVMENHLRQQLHGSF